MILNLEFDSDKAIYIQIKEQIIKAIAVGDLKINESLPSVRALAEEIGINLHTVNKAYNLLKDEGYIIIDRRKGAIIRNLPLKKSENDEALIKEEITSKSYLKGIKEEEFINICKDYFKKYGVKNNE